MRFVLGFVAGAVITALGLIGIAIMDSDLVVVKDGGYEA